MVVVCEPCDQARLAASTTGTQEIVIPHNTPGVWVGTSGRRGGNCKKDHCRSRMVILWSPRVNMENRLCPGVWKGKR